MGTRNPGNAVIWDFDGTLADTRARNIKVTGKILERVTGKSPDHWQALASPRAYARALSRTANWRELYRHEFQLTESQIDHAGGLWSVFQREERTPIRIFQGIAEVLARWNRVPHGIVSQNARDMIGQTLDQSRLTRNFSFIVGYEEVALQRQKPHPDGLLLCIEQLAGSAPGRVFYIGDHETDIQCALNADRVLARGGLEAQVVIIGACYGLEEDQPDWRCQPHHKAKHPRDIIAILENYT